MRPLLVLIVFIFALLALGAYFAGSPQALLSNLGMELRSPTAPKNALSPGALVTGADHQPYTLEVVAENLTVPWSLVFTSPDRLLVTERPGTIRVIQNGKLEANPVYTFSETTSSGEEGLMGLALDPAYDVNKLMYACLAYASDNGLKLKVTQLKDESTSLTLTKTLIENIPAAKFHTGCRVKFGPDGKLYVTTGDSANKQLAQDQNSLAGKILRLNPDGSVPSNNPFPNSVVYSLGHRNPQGLAWQSETNLLYSTEHGPSGFDGPGGGDEVNLIEAGKNYGWPTVSHDRSQSGLVDPMTIYTPAIAPASALIYTSDVFPQFKNALLLGALKGEAIWIVRFDPNDPRKIVENTELEGIKVGRIRDVIQGPDGLVYFTTSNRDGRGKARTGDDKIYRLIPQN